MPEPPVTTRFASELNPEQCAAVTAPGGPVLVLAAAGTGKTRTIVYRVAHLVERGVPAERILLLTFTNRAAREMLRRAEQLVGSGVGGLWGGTFHHLSNRILRRHAGRLGYSRDYTILDRDDARTLIAGCIRDLRLGGREFPKPDVLLAVSGEAANSGVAVEQAVEGRFAGSRVGGEDILRVLQRYAEKKRKLEAMDFDDLLVRCAELFREHDEVREEYADRFVHTLVDEFQDTNPLQSELVERLTAVHKNAFVVGDDFQSIYSWRGADFTNILAFPERHPDARIYKLETNYRSVPEILAVANACIAGNPEQFQKTLRATREPYRRPKVVRVRDGGAQARAVVDRIRSLQREGYRRSEIAVLYRAHYHAMEVQMQLTHEGIPYVITSGVRFFEQAHVKDVCSFLRLLVYPHDEMAFVRVLALLPGIGPKTAAALREKMGGRFDPGDPAQRVSLRRLLKADARRRWTAIEEVLEGFAQGGAEAAAAWIINRFVEVFYAEYALHAFENHQRRVDDLGELALYTEQFESLEGFLSEVALLTNLDAELESVQNDQDAVHLSTVHQAKGCEWDAVIVLWMADGMFPLSRSLHEGGGEPEERRLFYVAVTRARDELYLCVPEVKRRRDGGVTYCVVSRFLDEIPGELVEEVREVMI